MYQTTPYTPSYTVFYRSGTRVVYNDIVELIEDLGDFHGRRNRWLRGIKYEVAKGFNPVCDRCRQPLRNSDLGSKCYTYSYYLDLRTKQVKKERHEHKEHDVRYCIIVRDDFGRPYESTELLRLYEQAVPRNRRNYSQKWDDIDKEQQIKDRNIKARFGHNNLHYYRSLGTTNERRQYDAAFVEDVKPTNVRGRRSKNNIPNSWDDYRIGIHDHAKSWKTQRVRKQWMVNLDD